MRPTAMRLLFSCCVVAVTVAPTAARAQATPFGVNAAVVSQPPRIDGTLNDPAWKHAARVTLDWNFTLERPAAEATSAYVLVDAKYLYVAFVAQQREAITATQHLNDEALTDDDAVRIYLWPAGRDGIEYGFYSNPIGTRYATSTENTAFSPQWEAVGKTTAAGYVITERIPLNDMRGDGRGVWRLQFDRTIHASNETFEWAHAGAQQNTDSSMYAGILSGMRQAAHSARTQPRFAVYGLGEVRAGTPAGSTSRAGVDASLPITQTASFVATLHPDYSNVELDQQSIAPTVFPRRLSEVRPFFTQGANYYNNFQCNDCQSFPMLYTPAIPTPRGGYAVEGTQGSLTFAGFDAIGEQRNDMAQSLSWKSADSRYGALYQRSDVDLPGLHDVAEYYQAVAGNYHNFNSYITLGNERGSQISTPGAGKYNEYGLNLYTAKSGLFAAYHDVGTQYAPYDSLTSVNGVRGPTLYAYREWDNGSRTFIQSVKPTVDLEWLRDAGGRHAFESDTFNLTVATRNQWSLDLAAGSTYLRLPNSPGGVVNDNGVSLAYGENTPTASSIAYRAGHFGAGFLRSSDIKTALRVTRRSTLSLESYITDQTFANTAPLREQLLRVSLAVQMGPGESFALGWRKIAGTGPTFFTPPQYTDAVNLSCAYYRRFKGAELYLAYGTPNQLETQHEVLLKLIRYIGADKGT